MAIAPTAAARPSWPSRAAWKVVASCAAASARPNGPATASAATSCGEADSRALRSTYVEGEGDRFRLACCDRCGFALKVVSTLAPLSPPGLLVTELATVHLDMIARGAARPERGHGKDDIAGRASDAHRAATLPEGFDARLRRDDGVCMRSRAEGGQLLGPPQEGGEAIVPGVAAVDQGPARLAQEPGLDGVFDELLEGVGQAFEVAERDEQAGPPVLDDLDDAPGRGGDDRLGRWPRPRGRRSRTSRSARASRRRRCAA